jgi:tetratricopeptide (TPR) repeat protein
VRLKNLKSDEEGVTMKNLKRRKEILDVFREVKTLSYQGVIDRIKGNPTDILIDLDILVSFNFLQNVKSKGKVIRGPTALLRMRPRTAKQMKENPQKTLSRLEPLEREIPSWYRKLVVLTVLSQGEKTAQEVFVTMRDTYPDFTWKHQLVEASLKILEENKYVDQENKAASFALTSKGRSLLEKPAIHQFADLKLMKEESTTEMRALEILNLVKEKGPISSRRIAEHLQKEYGMKGNKRKAIRNTLQNMVYCGILKVTGGVGGRGGSIYHLGKTEAYVRLGGDKMGTHEIQDFKGVVNQFFRYSTVSSIKGKEPTVMEVLDELDHCKQDLSLRLPGEWVERIVTLSGYLEDVQGEQWEERAFRCIVACTLSRLLPSDITLYMLKDYPPPSMPLSGEQLLQFQGIAREYFFNMTEAYLEVAEFEEAFRSFEQLNLLCSETYDFLILKGRIEMLRRNIRDPAEFKILLNLFERALEKSKGRERITAYFYLGLIHYQRGDYEEAENHWKKALELENNQDRQIRIQHNLANAYRLSWKLEEARTLYETIRTLTQVLKGKEEFRIESLLGLANVLIDLCQWDEAQETLQEVIKECAEGEFPLLDGLARTNLGVLQYRRGKYEDALSHHEAALNLIDEDVHPVEYGSVLINMADTLRELKRTDEAFQALDKAATLVGGSDMTLAVAAQISRADLLISMGDFTGSMRLAQSVFQETWLGTLYPKAEVHRIRGTVYLHKKDFFRAKKELEESRETLEKPHLKYELLRIYGLLELCYRGLNDKKNEELCRADAERITQLMGKHP